MSGPIPVVDLFAGSGGLGEGFASCLADAQAPAFQLRLSIEMDPDAHTTLELRSFFRQFPQGAAPEAYYQRLRCAITTEALFALYPIQAQRARAAAWRVELGKAPPVELHERIRHAVWVEVRSGSSVAGRRAKPTRS